MYFQLFSQQHIQNANLQCTINVIRLLTDGGTPFEAMHKKLPICVRSTRAIGNVEPSANKTKCEHEEKKTNKESIRIEMNKTKN